MGLKECRETFFFILGPSAPPLIFDKLEKLVKSIIVPGNTAQKRKLEISMTQRGKIYILGGPCWIRKRNSLCHVEYFA